MVLDALSNCCGGGVYNDSDGVDGDRSGITSVLFTVRE